MTPSWLCYVARDITDTTRSLNNWLWLNQRRTPGWASPSQVHPERVKEQQQIASCAFKAAASHAVNCLHTEVSPEAKALRPTPARNWILPTTWADMGRGPQTSDETLITSWHLNFSLVNPWAKNPVNSYPESWPRETDKIKVFYFKLLILW